MFVHREAYTVATPRQADFEARVLDIQARMAQEPTSRGNLLLRFQGNASRYLAFRFWEAREDAAAWGQHPEMRAYMAARPPGNYLAPPQIDYWEDLHRFTGDADVTPAFAVQEECHTAAGKIEDFEAWNRDLSALSTQLGGFVGRRVYRFLGSPGRYVTLALWESQAQFEAALSTEELRAFLEGRPQMDHLNAAPVQEFYRVLYANEK